MTEFLHYFSKWFTTWKSVCITIKAKKSIPVVTASFFHELIYNITCMQQIHPFEHTLKYFAPTVICQWFCSVLWQGNLPFPNSKAKKCNPFVTHYAHTVKARHVLQRHYPLPQNCGGNNHYHNGTLQTMPIRHWRICYLHCVKKNLTPSPQ